MNTVGVLIKQRMARLTLICTGILGLAFSTLALSVSDYAVWLSANVQTNPAQVTLSWPAAAAATSCKIYRKSRDDGAWGFPVLLAANATNYVDSSVVVGAAYEYQIWRTPVGYDSYGYIYTGLAVPPVDSRGKVVLLVENNVTASLSNELARLQQDLIGDGWMVLRHDVARMAVEPANTSPTVWSARSNEVARIKALILADYNAAPADVKAVFILGHVPVPYSGDLYPDGHDNHRGAWPADAFYGDVNGAWTDAALTSTTGSDLRNRNVPGDGKFDQTRIASNLELQVGRVDFANMPAFPQSEIELLRRYLNKDHAFRHGNFIAARRGIIDDGFGLSTGEAFAANGWRDFSAFFGPTNTFAGDWLTTLSSQSYLWGYACGAGSYTSEAGVANTAQLVTSDPRVVFSMHFGSYFGDWDSPNNVLRAQLATTNYTLTSAWVGRPFWYFHHMGLGETIGFSTHVSQNDDGTLYSGSGHRQFVSIALMGDPTLRMHVVAPPANLFVATNRTGGVDIRWTPAFEAVAGYHVYRAPNPGGPFVRLNNLLINGTNYSDPVLAKSTYMLRAVKLEVSGSGSYYNASQGVFHDFAPPAAKPLLVITAQNLSKFYGEPLPILTASYSGFINDDTPAGLDCPAVLSTAATSNSGAGTYSIEVSGAADTNYVITFVPGTLTVRRAPSAGLLTSSANPSLPGHSITFTCTVNSVTDGLGTPIGSVQFRVDGQNVGAPVLLNDTSATYTALLSSGWHGVEAEYAGDGNFAPTKITLDVGQLVNTSPVAGADFLGRDPTNGVTIPIVALLANDFDADGDLIFFLDTDTVSEHGGSLVSDEESVFYTPAVGYTNKDNFTYTISDGYSSTRGMVTLNVPMDTASTLLISNLGTAYAIRGVGVPGQSYRIESTKQLWATNWQTSGMATGDSSGYFLFIDSTVATQRFYRSVSP